MVATLVAGTEYTIGATWSPAGLTVAVNGLVETTTTNNGGLWVPAATAYVGSNGGAASWLIGSVRDLQVLDRAVGLSDLCTLTNGQRIPHLDFATLYAPFQGNLSTFARAKRWEK